MDVLNDMTRPRTVPRTVSIWFEMPRLWLVISDTSVTTSRILNEYP